MINFYVLRSSPIVVPPRVEKMEKASSPEKSLWHRVEQIGAAILAFFGIWKKSEKVEVGGGTSSEWRPGLIRDEKWLTDQLNERLQYGKKLLEKTELVGAKKAQRDALPEESLERTSLKEEIRLLEKEVEDINDNIVIIDKKIFKFYGKSNYENMKNWAQSKSFAELEKSASFTTNDRGEEFAGFTITPSVLNETQWIIDKIAGVDPRPFVKDEKGNIRVQECAYNLTFDASAKPRMDSAEIPPIA